MALITLLTDFGLADTYVGQMKGAVLSVLPNAIVVDLTHTVPAQDIVAGAFLLWTAVEVFPPDSIHLAVVDPGVGSARRGLALRSRRGDVFVGPDNGLLMPAARRLGGVDVAIELNRAEYWRPRGSSTFHGRDIFGPVAGHIASGVRLEDLGSALADPIDLALPEPRGLEGEVVHVDAYGNLVTNLAAANLPPRFNVRLGAYLIRQAHAYADVASGELLALVGSAGLLEISARDASAASITTARRGTRVSLELA